MEQQQTKTEITSEKKEKRLNWVQIISILMAGAALIVSIQSYIHSTSSFEIENRAYIYIQGVYPSNIYEPFFEVKFKNYGKTPAKEIKVGGVRIFSEEVISFDYSLELDNAELALLISGDEKTFRVSSNKTYYSIAEQLGKVFIVGKLTYKDIFDETHQTQYAGWLRAHGDNTFLNFQGNLNLSD